MQVLAKTDKKIAEKLRNQRLTEQAAKQTLAAFDFDDIEAVDSLTDDEIDEILLSIIGDDEGEVAGSLEFDYYDDYEVSFFLIFKIWQ